MLSYNCTFYKRKMDIVLIMLNISKGKLGLFQAIDWFSDSEPNIFLLSWFISRGIIILDIFVKSELDAEFSLMLVLWNSLTHAETKKCNKMMRCFNAWRDTFSEQDYYHYHYHWRRCCICACWFQYNWIILSYCLFKCIFHLSDDWLSFEIHAVLSLKNRYISLGWEIHILITACACTTLLTSAQIVVCCVCHEHFLLAVGRLVGSYALYKKLERRFHCTLFLSQFITSFTSS